MDVEIDLCKIHLRTACSLNAIRFTDPSCIKYVSKFEHIKKKPFYRCKKLNEEVLDG